MKYQDQAAAKAVQRLKEAELSGIEIVDAHTEFPTVKFVGWRAQYDVHDLQMLTEILEELRDDAMDHINLN